MVRNAFVTTTNPNTVPGSGPWTLAPEICPASLPRYMTATNSSLLRVITWRVHRVLFSQPKLPVDWEEVCGSRLFLEGTIQSISDRLPGAELEERAVCGESNSILSAKDGVYCKREETSGAHSAELLGSMNCQMPTKGCLQHTDFISH